MNQGDSPGGSARVARRAGASRSQPCGRPARSTPSSPRTSSMPCSAIQGGATGVIQASTAFWPGASERMEFHGTKGTAIVTGDRLTSWTRAGRRGRAAAALDRGRLGRVRSDGDFARTVRAAVPRLRPRGARNAAGRSSAVTTDLAAIRIVDAVYRASRTGESVVTIDISRRRADERSARRWRRSPTSTRQISTWRSPPWPRSGMTGVELRTVGGRSIVDLSNAELDRHPPQGG